MKTLTTLFLSLALYLTLEMSYAQTATTATNQDSLALSRLVTNVGVVKTKVEATQRTTTSGVRVLGDSLNAVSRRISSLDSLSRAHHDSVAANLSLQIARLQDSMPSLKERLAYFAAFLLFFALGGWFMYSVAYARGQAAGTVRMERVEVPVPNLDKTTYRPEHFLQGDRSIGTIGDPRLGSNFWAYAMQEAGGNILTLGNSPHIIENPSELRSVAFTGIPSDHPSWVRHT